MGDNVFVNYRIPYYYYYYVLNDKVRELLLITVDSDNLSAEGFTSVGGQIGVGIEGSPASLINV
ncbi:hypothetical protein SGQ44_13425 [Flavobacterium sp. Fl-77]|uniref:Uncharacterized protein n=1 Tax=Flavobacterium flavipigmentatum TaxID=2893884 RepID=A0AAJ2VZ07_9FLAO|nr:MULTISPECIES: hypothetical protein [unclassified Flavobacterium]MDX6183167.1 hypothetical protein [Flavobacterium sp. Fl-33]MDX6186764.1 hypothetical protein [Flavobacterium sp. Fl-77]UFH40418.1 hypothetical protein LNP22_09105 [Flavobacterium sp. F-70]